MAKIHKTIDIPKEFSRILVNHCKQRKESKTKIIQKVIAEFVARCQKNTNIKDSRVLRLKSETEKRWLEEKETSEVTFNIEEETWEKFKYYCKSILGESMKSILVMLIYRKIISLTKRGAKAARPQENNK